MKKIQNLQSFEELLESDDELPDTYIETTDIPAYLDDNRFAKCDQILKKRKSEVNPTVKFSEKKINLDSPKNDPIPKNDPNPKKEPNLKNDPNPKNDLNPKRDPTPKAIILSTEDSSSSESSYLSQQISEAQTPLKKTLISKGFLTKRDLFYLKSIEEYSTDTTLLWFINFLESKSFRPLQRSCLVVDVIPDCYTQISKQSLLGDEMNMRYYLKLAVD